MYKVSVQHGIAEAGDGVRIAYQISGEGPALVFCHAMANDHRMYDRHRDLFSASYTFITFDQRGSGNSDHPPFEQGHFSFYTAEKFGEDLKAVLDAIGIVRARVLGFSMGAVAALSFSSRWPDRVEQLMLVSAMASRLPQTIIDRARLVEKILDEKGIKEAYDFYFSGSLFDGLSEENAIQEAIALARAKATPHGFKGCFRVTIDRPSMVDKLCAIQCPTLILVGENDTHYLTEAEILEQAITNAKRVVMPGVGHPMAAQDPKAFEAEIMAFISSI
jgi:pimeloyl-ACP methyl ester carboxylesterase